MNATSRADCSRASYSDEARIREEAACWTLAIREKEADRVLHHYGPSTVTFGLAPPLVASTDRAARKAALLAWFADWDGPIDIDIHNLRVEVAGDRAFTHSMNHLSGKRTSGDAVSMWFRATVGYRKVDERWLIVHEHQSVPFDMRTMKACVDLVP